MNVNPSEVQKRSVSIGQYMDGLREPFREKFFTAKREYRLKEDTIEQLKESASNHFIVVFSTEWCEDCWTVIPALALINEATRLEVRVFSGLKKDVLGYAFKWRIPPSPPEVNSFGVDKIPLILVFNNMGVQIGRIVEKPKRMPTLEEELNEIMKHTKPLSSQPR
jgi:hypothetical protein